MFGSYSFGQAPFASTGSNTGITVTHSATGALQGAGASISGSAARSRIHDAAGVIAGAGAALSGASARSHIHAGSGDLSGAGATLTGSAARIHVHDALGGLAGTGAALAGSAARVGGAVTHEATGGLSGQGTTIAGSAERIRIRTATGALQGAGAALSGAAELQSATQHLHGRRIRRRGRIIRFADEFLPVEEVSAKVERIEAPTLPALAPIAATIETAKREVVALAARIEAEREAQARQAQVDALVSELNGVLAALEHAQAAEAAWLKRIRDDDEFFLLAA